MTIRWRGASCKQNPHKPEPQHGVRDALAVRPGFHPTSLKRRRYPLGIPRVRNQHPFTPAREWTRADDRQLGTMPDPAVAGQLSCTPRMVYNRRVKLGVAAFIAGD